MANGSARDVIRYAERWIAVLEKQYPPDDPVFLRPVAAACAASVGLNNLSKARQLFDRLQRLRADSLGDRALVHRTAVVILAREGNVREAENEMREAVADVEGGQFHGLEEAWALHQFGRLYMDQGRYKEAKTAVARAIDMVSAASDKRPLDLIKMLEFGAVIDVRTDNWRDAERKLARATAIADVAPELDASVMRELLFCYSAVLHKVGRGRDAREVEKRLAVLPPDPARSIVDIEQLKGRKRLR